MWAESLAFEVDGAAGNFVGFRIEGGKRVFVLPKGCDTLAEELTDQFASASEEARRNGFDTMTRVFFTMYRVFRRFEAESMADQNRKSREFHTKHTGSDPYHRPEGGGVSLETTFGGDEDIRPMFYSKLAWLDELLERCPELEYADVDEVRRSTDEIDYSRLHQYLHRAIYLEDDVAYVDRMETPLPVILYQATDLIRMLCFFQEEVRRQLDPHGMSVSRRVSELATEFRDRYLTPSASLFAYDSFRLCILTCRDVLEQIYRQTGYKSDQFLDLYEVAERFIHGENCSDKPDGYEWGIDNFSHVWEDICHYYLFREKKFVDSVNKVNIQYADTNIKVNGQFVANEGKGLHESPTNRRYFRHKDFKNVFCISISGRSNRAGCEPIRWMRPDMVFSFEEDNQAKHVVLDMKYWGPEKGREGKIENKKDGIAWAKQKMYEACLFARYNQPPGNHMLVPVWRGGDGSVFVAAQNGKNVMCKPFGIGIVEGDFDQLSRFYAESDDFPSQLL